MCRAELAPCAPWFEERLVPCSRTNRNNYRVGRHEDGVSSSGNDRNTAGEGAARDLAQAGYKGQLSVQEIDAPHMLLQTRPAECAQAIAAFTRYLPPVPMH